MNNTNTMPFSIQILTNLNCNLNCSYCYEHKTDKVNDIESIKKFIDFRYKDGKMDTTPDRLVIIEIIGGESFLYPELLDEIFEYANKVHTKYKCYCKPIFSISTNATLLNNKNVQGLCIKWKNQLDIGVSIDGTKEIHDKCRIDINGNPTYDRAIAGLNWLIDKLKMNPNHLGVKATYCHDTIENYAEGVINLIKLGFTQIGANVVFEEIWDKEKDSLVIVNQMYDVIDYLFENDLENSVNIFQINSKDIDMLHYVAEMGSKEQNHCGTCKYMMCIGFDNKVYGCNRFCTMPNDIPVGYVSDSGIIITQEGHNFIQEVSNQYKLYPDECKKCEYGSQCPSCSAIPYESDMTVKEFFEQKGQCGFTYAIIAARLYFRYRLFKKLNPDKD